MIVSVCHKLLECQNVMWLYFNLLNIIDFNICWSTCMCLKCTLSINGIGLTLKRYEYSDTIIIE